jgi:hypothetical protein
MDRKIFMRWSDGKSFAVPFPVGKPADIAAGISKFRAVSNRNAHLHVFIPHSAGGHWCDPIHRKHIIAPGDGPHVQAHPETILPSGLMSEEIIVFKEDDCDNLLDSAKKTFQLWETSIGQDYTECAMADSVTLLKTDLVANIRRAANDDLVPIPTDHAKLLDLAKKYRVDASAATEAIGGGK